MEAEQKTGLACTPLYSLVDKKAQGEGGTDPREGRKEGVGEREGEGGGEGREGVGEETGVGVGEEGRNSILTGWEELGSRQFTLEELLELQGQEAGAGGRGEESEAEAGESGEVSKAGAGGRVEESESGAGGRGEESEAGDRTQGLEEEYPYFCREGRGTVRRQEQGQEQEQRQEQKQGQEQE